MHIYSLIKPVPACAATWPTAAHQQATCMISLCCMMLNALHTARTHYTHRTTLTVNFVTVFPEHLFHVFFSASPIAAQLASVFKAKNPDEGVHRFVCWPCLTTKCSFYYIYLQQLQRQKRTSYILSHHIKP